MTYVYMLQSEDGEHFYVGVSSDVYARLKQHNAGQVSHTSKFAPWQLRAFIAFADETRAYAFEKYLKSGSGRAFAAKRL